MDRIAYVDGRFCPFEEARIPLDDRSLFFGDAVYDALIGKDGRVFDMPAHMTRLKSNMCALGIAAPLPPADMERYLLEAASFFHDSVCFLYIQVSRTAAHRRHGYPTDAASRLLITAERMGEPSPDRLLRLITTEDRRYGFCHIKTVNLLPNVLASHEADEAGADEAVFLRDGRVTECAHSNLSILVGRTLYTHPTDGRILPGITRHRLLDLCRHLGVAVREEAFGIEALMQADDVLVSSTSKLCMRAKTVDGTAVGGHTSLGRELCERMYEDFLSELGG